MRDTSAVRLLALEARGNASARTQVASEGSGPARPAINYSRGTLIRVTMDSTSEVSRVLVEGRAVGLYLEPVVTPAPRDSAGRAATPGTPGPTGTPSRAPVPPVTPASTPTRATPAKP
ncbi:MAG: hypothetical protein MUF21_09485 [Gemmatimonadaceae bacterium]|nr:hypothetical protein [Gemmatimonadaceae bacterium]